MGNSENKVTSYIWILFYLHFGLYCTF